MQSTQTRSYKQITRQITESSRSHTLSTFFNRNEKKRAKEEVSISTGVQVSSRRADPDSSEISKTQTSLSCAIHPTRDEISCCYNLAIYNRVKRHAPEITHTLKWTTHREERMTRNRTVAAGRDGGGRCEIDMHHQSLIIFISRHAWLVFSFVSRHLLCSKKKKKKE
jgi:hypothetical protein